MQELLSKTADPKTPPCEREFYELRLDDSDDIGQTGLIVSQTRAQWREIARAIMRDDFEIERCLLSVHSTASSFSA